MAHCKQTLRLVLLLVISLSSLAALNGCGGSDGGANPQQEPGEAAYARYCAGCHGVEGQGRSPAFPPLDGSEWLALPPEGLTAIVLLGLRGEIEVAGARYAGYMPPMQHIDDERVAAIVRHIKARWSDAADDWTGDDVARLRSALAGRGSPDGRAGVENILEELQ